MSNADILAQLTEIFRRIFENPSISLQPSMTADDIPGWDSMANIMLAAEIEHQFNVKFKTAEMEELRDIGQLLALIRSRVAVTAQ